MTDPRPSENTEPRFEPKIDNTGRPYVLDTISGRRANFSTVDVTHRLTALLNKNHDEALMFVWIEPGPEPAIGAAESVADIGQALQDISRHLEAIAHELRLKNRVVGL